MALSDKKRDQIESLLGKETVEELQTMQPEQLKHRLTQAQQAIKQAQEELEANAKYQEAKEDIRHLSGGLKDVKKRQNAISTLVLELLEERGE